MIFSFVPSGRVASKVSIAIAKIYHLVMTCPRVVFSSGFSLTVALSLAPPRAAFVLSTNPDRSLVQKLKHSSDGKRLRRFASKDAQLLPVFMTFIVNAGLQGNGEAQGEGDGAVRADIGKD